MYSFRHSLGDQGHYDTEIAAYVAVGGSMPNNAAGCEFSLNRREAQSELARTGADEHIGFTSDKAEFMYGTLYGTVAFTHDYETVFGVNQGD